MSDTKANKETVRSFFKALAAFDAQTLMSLLTDDVKLNVTGTGCMSGTLTRDALPTVGQALAAICPDGIQFSVQEMIAEDNLVSARVEGKGVMSDGSIYNNHYHFFFRFRDGKICETYEYMDTLLVENVFGPMLAQQQSQ